MIVKDPIAGPDDCLWRYAICESKPRSKIVAVRRNKRFLSQRSLGRSDELSGCDIKVRPFQISLSRRRRKFIAQAKIHCELPVDSPIILDESEIHVLVDLEGRVGVLLVSPRKP